MNTRLVFRPMLLVTGLILLVFIPNLMHLSTAAFGGADTDALKHVWTQWWVVHRVLQDGAIPLESSLIHHPTGGAFFAIDTVNALLGLPFRAFAGPVATYNIVVILNLILAGWATTRLAQALGAGPWPSIIAGVGWPVSAWVLAFPLGSGVSEAAFFFPVPLILLLAVRTVVRTGWWAPLGGAILLALQGLGCWSHGITTGVALMFMGIAWLTQRPWHASVDDPAHLDRGTIIRLLVAGGALLLMILPAYLAISGTVQDLDAVKVRHLSLFPSSPISPLDVPEANSLAIESFIQAGAAGLRDGAAGPERLMYSGYLGWLLLGMAAVALRFGDRRDRWIGAGAMVFVLLALGPRIHLEIAHSKTGLPNPLYLLLYYVFPLFNATIHSVDRLVMGAQLGTALLAAKGLTILIANQTASRKMVLSLVGALFILAEVLLISPPPWPIPMVKATHHESAVALGERPGVGAVLDLPFLTADGRQTTRFAGDIFLQQTAHGRPIPFQLEGMDDESLSPATRANPFYQAISRSLRTGRVPTDCDGARGLAQLGFDHLIWRTRLVKTDLEPTLRRHLIRCLGEGEAFGDRIVFSVRP